MEEEVSLVDFSFDEKFIYFISGKNTLSICNFQENQEIITQKFEGLEIKSVCFLPNVNDKLLVGFAKNHLNKEDSTLKLVIINQYLVITNIQFLREEKLNNFDKTIEIIQEIANDNENLYFILRTDYHEFQTYVFKADYSVQAITSQNSLSSVKNNEDKFPSFVFHNNKKIITGSKNSKIFCHQITESHQSERIQTPSVV